MAKNRKTEQKEKFTKKRFTPKSPYQTWWGKTLLIILLLGMAALPIVALIQILINL